MSAIIQSSNPILSQYLRNQMLLAMTVRPPGFLWQTPKVHLSHDPAPSWGAATALSVFTAQEANFSGYSSQTPTATVPVNLDATTQGLIATVVFEAIVASPFVSDNVTGYWCDDGTNPIAYEATNVANPVAVASANDYVQVDLRIPLDYLQAV